MNSAESITPTVESLGGSSSDSTTVTPTHCRPFGPMTEAAMIPESIVPTRFKRITK